jgi:hypothetical protein
MLALTPARLGPTASRAVASSTDPSRTAVQIRHISMAALRLFVANLHKGVDAFESKLLQPKPLRIVEDVVRMIGERASSWL